MRVRVRAYTYARTRGAAKGNKVKTFWKDLTVKQRKELLARLFSVIISGVMIVVIGVVSLAWFATNNTVSQREMQITVSNDAVEILIERTTAYDSGYDGISGLKSALTAANYSLSATNTSSSPLLAYELVNEYSTRIDGVDRYYLQPGSFGTVTFYIRPKEGKDETIVNFSLERGGFTADYEEISNDNVKNLLKGHMLFFTGKTDGNYSGLLDTDTFTYDMGAHDKCSKPGKTDCYEVVLYWAWPITYYDIVKNISTTSPAVTKKYPSEMTDYLSNGAYFFKGTYDENDNDSKSDAYNDGDQTIGDAMDYFVLYMKLL